jgi:pimeloyl-ACP methyl ester carboxylesterase
MIATKATYLDQWACERGQAYVRFDYTGHGESSGNFREGTISQWLHDACQVINAHATHETVLVGSSMGGWLALLAARWLRQHQPEKAPVGLVLIAPAVDFTQNLMWDTFSDNIRQDIMEHGEWLRPSAYSSDPTPITRALIEDGRKHLLLNDLIDPQCPVHILQGMVDSDVPYTHALKLLEHLPATNTTLTLIKDGDHRLSRDEDLKMLVHAVQRMIKRA